MTSALKKCPAKHFSVYVCVHVCTCVREYSPRKTCRWTVMFSLLPLWWFLCWDCLFCRLCRWSSSCFKLSIRLSVSASDESSYDPFPVDFDGMQSKRLDSVLHAADWITDLPSHSSLWSSPPLILSHFSSPLKDNNIILTPRPLLMTGGKGTVKQSQSLLYL